MGMHPLMNQRSSIPEQSWALHLCLHSRCDIEDNPPDQTTEDITWNEVIYAEGVLMLEALPKRALLGCSTLDRLALLPAVQSSTPFQSSLIQQRWYSVVFVSAG